MEAAYLRLLISLLSLLFLTVSAETSPTCVTRRCLANELIAQEIISQPQTANCSVEVFLRQIMYKTVDVDTKSLLFTSSLIIMMEWVDPALAWNRSVYPYETVMVPIDKVWTPLLHVKNSVSTQSESSSSDLLVYSNGTVEHVIIMHISVDCDINLYSYPYTVDSCPIYLNGRTSMGCGTVVHFGTIMLKGGERGDWRTEEVENIEDRNGDTYLWVTMSTRSFNPTVTLILPSALIMLADMASYSLPLGKSDRVSFKVTLVLSFVMFLLILSDILPGDSFCSPLIRYHFCICLICLVISMIQSMLTTRLAAEGSLLPFRLPRWCSPCGGPASPEDGADTAEPGPELLSTVVNLKAEAEAAALRKVVKYLEDVTRRERQAKRRASYANRVDRMCFWGYVGLFLAYSACAVFMIGFYKCKVDHFNL
ncbi:zinc-activated ligand-gated ion channel-like [Megalops cyprinoides]|uniref:zinc-activated ligand-gated ion channel-like n=1 Tax=Megalops cyprinoides TaxID=118141 RepID=UPI0018650DD6|nr:zinc-activated ligand-gated ion channel-like [Megalops cyprinoides]